MYINNMLMEKLIFTHSDPHMNGPTSEIRSDNYLASEYYNDGCIYKY